MIINDFFFIILWFLFFSKFPEINGWNFKDMMLLMSINTMSYGLCMILFAGCLNLAKMIQNGEVDNYLILPPNLLWHISASKTFPSDFGDFLFGFILFFFSGDVSFEKFLITFFLVIFASMILFSFTVITQSLAFFIEHFEETAIELFHSLLGFTLYPQNAYVGFLKILVMTIFPAFLMTGLPIALINQFDLKWFLILGGISIFAFVFSFYFFHLGLKKYESGNLIGVNK
jgi:ABC-2 type transport system permease protein